MCTLGNWLMQLWRLASLKSARRTSGLEAQGRADGAVQVQRLAMAGFCLAQVRSFFYSTWAFS